jgi:amino acid transporter
MAMTHMLALAWMMGLLLAPHTLARLGNLVGVHQGGVFFLLIVAASLYWLNARSVNMLARRSDPIINGEKRSVLMMLSLGSRWVISVVLPTVLLVTAGFTFNETFVYWFPNFAFAFLILGLLLMVQLFGPAVTGRLQLSLVALVLSGIAVLITMGLWTGSPEMPLHVEQDSIVHGHAYLSVLLLFVGFDVVTHHSVYKGAVPIRILGLGLLIASLVYGLWGLTSLLYVPGGKLIKSFIPHVLTARSIGGDVGRMIMGMVTIAGSCAAVNALMSSQAQLMSALAARLWPGRLKSLYLQPAAWAILNTILVGLMMAGGMAGTDAIDVWVRAGLIIWMVYYAAVHWKVTTLAYREGSLTQWSQWVLPAAGALIMVSGSVLLILMDPERTILSKHNG